MAYSFNDTTASSSTDVHIDISSEQGDSVQAFSQKTLARLIQILAWFNALGAGNGTVTNATNATNATTATTATKLSNTAAIGSSTAPVYFNASGVPVACGDSLAVDITGNAATATSATTAASCTGNAATATSATTAASCTGNAATATYATSAGSATKATKDSSGNNIASTYATKATAGVANWSARTSLSGSTRSFTAPSAGFYVMSWQGYDAERYIYLNGYEVGHMRFDDSSGDYSLTIPVKTGDVLSYSGNNIRTGYFVPLS